MRGLTKDYDCWCADTSTLSKYKQTAMNGPWIECIGFRKKSSYGSRQPLRIIDAKHRADGAELREISMFHTYTRDQIIDTMS